MLAGRRILIVEDDYYLARDLACAFAGEGAEVVGPYPSIAKAMAALAIHDVSGATLDVELVDGRSYGVAAVLRARGTPFVFATGHHCRDLPCDLAQAPRLEKPYESRRVVEALATAIRATP